MAVNFILGSTSTVSVGDGDTAILPEGYSILTTTGDGVDLAEVNATAFYNHGTVLAAGSAIIAGSNNSHIVNTGLLQGLEHGIVVNNWSAEGNQRIINYGDIIAKNTPIMSGFVSHSQGSNLILTNAGRIISEDDNPIVNTFNLLGVTITNTGFIKGGELRMDGIRDARLTNTGTIVTTDEVDMNCRGNARVYNTGQIIDTQGDAGGTVLRTSANDDVVGNAGLIAGAVNLGAGADLYRAMGDGFVSLGVFGFAGNDTLLGGSDNDLLDGGSENDLIIGHDGSDSLSGGLGDDQLLAGAGDDVLDGGGDRDTVNGGEGDDTLDGGDGDDTLLGQDGSDDLDGGAGDDLLLAGAHDDVLFGGTGNDILRGHAGADQLEGGRGRDVLIGGAGADVFLFRNTLQAGIGADRDVIIDFEQGVDLIVVAGMIPGQFDFIGTSPFTGANQVRLRETTTGSTIVQFNTDADLDPEAEIRVADVIGLTADDFHL